LVAEPAGVGDSVPERGAERLGEGYATQ
jgi:hypothetical protein